MISPGSLPNYRARGAHKRWTYVRERRKSRAKRGADQHARVDPWSIGEPSLPVATVRVHAVSLGSLARSLRGWTSAQLVWMRPRAIPAVFALLGLFAMLATTDYLHRTAHGMTAEQQAASAAHVRLGARGPMVGAILPR